MIEKGRKACVHYVGTLADGSEFDNSYKRGQTLEFIVGARQVLPAFEATVLDMQAGEKRTVQIPAAEAYGVYDEGLVEQVPVDVFPNAEDLPVGQFIVFSAPTGPLRVKVLKIEDGLIHFDSNHELAGQDLTFQIELVSVPGVSGSLIENELYNTGSCDCGCDELRHQLSGQPAAAPEHAHSHTHAHQHGEGCSHDY